MNRSLLLFCIPALFASCATHRSASVGVTPTFVPGNALPSRGVESVRYAENIKAYPVSRYIDPSNRLVMHEGHTVYRVETTPHWNLHPNIPVAIPIGPVWAGLSSKAASPVNDELVMEINRQKAATKTLIQGTTAVFSKLDELSQGVEKTRQIARETQELKQQVDTTSQRLGALEQELRRREQSLSPATSNTPARDDSNW